MRETRLGALVGLIGFLFFGLMPGFWFGGYSAIAMLTRLTGNPLVGGVFERVVVGCGILLGVTCTCFLFVVLGAILGTLCGYAVGIFDRGVAVRVK